MSELRFCPKCGTLMQRKKFPYGIKYVCPACGYIEPPIQSPKEAKHIHSSEKQSYTALELHVSHRDSRTPKSEKEFQLITSSDKRVLRDIIERYVESINQKREEDMPDIFRDYFSWDARISYRILREAGYRTLAENLFSSPQDIDDLLFDDFDEYILQLGKIHFRGRTRRITIRNLLKDWLYYYSYDDIVDFIESDELVVLGHLSWTNLYRQKELIRKEWPQAKEFLKAILFGENGIHIRDISENEVFQRLSKTYHIPKGFGKNIITAMLMICDEKRRFGLWNNISISALKKFGFWGISAQGFSITQYTNLNEIIHQMMREIGFVDPVDIDMWAWWSTTYQDKFQHLI